MKTMTYASPLFFASVCATLLSGCKSLQQSDSVLVHPNRIIEKRIAVDKPVPQVKATFGLSNDPKVVAAYQRYAKKGQAKAIQSRGFRTLPYDAYSHPIIACQPMRLCVVQLEQGERINNIAVGDAAHWLVSTAKVGMGEGASYQVTIKPKRFDVATDMVITTTKRTYNIGLVSKEGATTHVVNFYYPQETLVQTVSSERSNASGTTGVTSRQHIVSDASRVRLDQVNFNYAIRGRRCTWRPQRVFDDGMKTFVQMPSIVSQMDLPILYIQRNGQRQMVNYRYQKPYFVIDGIIEKAFLFSGKGKKAEQVTIINRRFR